MQLNIASNESNIESAGSFNGTGTYGRMKAGRDRCYLTGTRLFKSASQFCTRSIC